MNTLVTGGAGFIGRWLVKRLLGDGHAVTVLDNMSNGSAENLAGLASDGGGAKLRVGDIKDAAILESVFAAEKFDICYHLAASINVQDSIDDPRTTFENDVLGTFNVLERCRAQMCKMVFMSTCMVYDRAPDGGAGIGEGHALKAASPYAGSKIAAESMALSYWHAYRLPVTVVRPFNTYGPFQKSGGEGGVVSVFIKNALEGLPLRIYGDGEQTRDLLYAEDCAEFVALAGYSGRADGEVLNAGCGRDIKIKDLALMICRDPGQIEFVPHIHPQSEIMRLRCDSRKAAAMLGWTPRVGIEAGARRAREWIESQVGRG
ncbi:MAG: GDP-mannose 4,6-dehydratase [Clostridiales bacterium]|jgi:nucleoside-diphosphate-sugar epimerase|nr:GDP-mannose 4,6-dehydratase [Clostridiales bacterium]